VTNPAIPHSRGLDPRRPLVDLDDTRRCGRGNRCECCGDEHPRLAVGTFHTDRGVLCLTRCPRCAASTVDPPLAASTVVRLVAQHCTHLRIDLATMRSRLGKS
jgi:hypothetical protein